jgi:hypothetical protein
MPLIPPAAAQRMNTGAYFVFALILFAVGAGFIWAGRTGAPSDDAAAKVFASDPSCAESLSRDLPAGACRTFDAMVLGTEARYHGVGKTRGHDSVVSVRLSDGTIYERDLAGRDGDLFVYAVKSGSPARVQEFRGEIVRIVAGGLTVETMSAPDVSAQADSEMPWAGAGLIAVALLFAFFGVRAALRPSQPAPS